MSQSTISLSQKRRTLNKRSHAHEHSITYTDKAFTLVYSGNRLSSSMRRNLLTCSWGSSMVRIFWISLRLSSSALRLSSSALRLSSSALLLFSCLLFSARLSFLSSWRRFSTMLSRLRSSLLLEFWRLMLVPASGLRGAGDLPDEVDLELLLPVFLTF